MRFSLLCTALFFSLGVLCQVKPLKYLALGDSYTIGESVEESDRWPNQLSEKLRKNGFEVETEIIAKTGWRADELLHAITSSKNLGIRYDMVSLLIGVNNQYQGRPFKQYQEEFVNLLETAIALASGDTNRVFVVSIPDYYYTPFGQENRTNLVSRKIDQYNEFAEDICAVYHIEYLNITRISREGISQPNLVAEDELHPSSSQYKRWVEEVIHHEVQSQFKN